MPKRQISLPFIKSIEIAFLSIRVRFFRSLITTITLVLAVFFLCYVRTGNTIANHLLKTGDQQLFMALVKNGYDITPQDKHVDANPKQRWIVFLSLLVCVVGIINAQLMSVTERFKEIGTMKCLGALDHFIMRLFLLEAGIQGFIGSILGAMIGSFFAILTSLFSYGLIVFSIVKWSNILAVIGYSVIVGCFLSLLGVLYPSLVAARMQPVEAMRVEN